MCAADSVTQNPFWKRGVCSHCVTNSDPRLVQRRSFYNIPYIVRRVIDLLGLCIITLVFISA